MFSPSPIVVRMPPSPTGSLHLGTARTALFNYCFAKKEGGKIIFRWEDTDRERSKTEYETEILEGLKWLGMDFKREASLLLRQTDNTPFHQKELQRLAAEGKIFPCFTTTQEIDAQRQKAEQDRTNFVFWSPFREISQETLEAKMKEGIPFVWRLRVTKDRNIEFEDLIRGKISVNSSTLGDFAVARSDGSVLYPLANVLDDLDQGVTHVIRGEDHISNTPKQLLLWEALGATPAAYGHIPLVLDQKGAKLSKRKVDPGVCVLIKDFQTQGFIPEGVVNGLSMLGWHPKTEEEIFSLRDLCERFTLSGIHKAGAKYDFEKMRWFNHTWMRKLPGEELFSRFIVWQKTYRPENRKPYEWNDRMKKALPIATEKSETLAELSDELDYVLFDLEDFDQNLLGNEKMKFDVSQAKNTLKSVFNFLEKLPEDQFTAPALKEALHQWITENGFQNGAVLWPLRVALSGRAKSMPPFEMGEILGKEEVMRRIREAYL